MEYALFCLSTSYSSQGAGFKVPESEATYGKMD